LLTPLLTVVFGVPMPIAVGTGLCMMVGTATVSYLRHQRSGNGEPRFDLTMLGGSLVGVDAGARLLSALSRAGSIVVRGRPVPAVSLVVEGLFSLLLAGTAILFWAQSRSADGGEAARPGPLARVAWPPFIDLPSVPLRRVSAPLIAYLGLALGVLSGLLGVGGGVVLMPVLVYGFGFPLRQAAGTGILVLLASAMMGTFVHALAGHVELRLAFPLLVTATLSAQLGARATRRLPARTLRRGFALVVVAAMSAVLWDLARRVAG
jgi:hypothetical protein